MNVTLRVSSADFDGAIAKGSLLEKGVKTLVTLAAREDSKSYVPYLNGDLRATAETESQPEHGLLIWGNANAPYAAAQYYGLPGKTWPGTCMQWFEAAKAAHLSQWIDIAQEGANEIAGSRA